MYREREREREDCAPRGLKEFVAPRATPQAPRSTARSRSLPRTARCTADCYALYRCTTLGCTVRFHYLLSAITTTTTIPLRI